MAPEPTAYLELNASAGSLLPSYLEPRLLKRCVTVGLVVSALTAWVAVGAYLAHLLQLRSELSGAVVDPQARHQVEVAVRIAQGVQAAAFGLTALAFFAWLYRLRVNARALGVRKLDYKRHWSVLGFLVPALNFVRPFQVISEIWRASDPSVLDPFEWKTLEPPRILLLWWGTVVVAATLVLAAFGLGQTAGVDTFKSLIASGVAVIASAATAVSASLAFFVVTGLAAAQVAKHRRLRHEASLS